MPASASFLQTAMALGVVLALIAACAWLARRVQRPLAGGSNALRLRGQIMVGPRERVVLIEVADQWVVAGVASGSVRPLAVLPRQADDAADAAAAAAAGPGFGALLARLRKQ